MRAHVPIPSHLVLLHEADDLQRSLAARLRISDLRDHAHARPGMSVLGSACGQYVSRLYHSLGLLCGHFTEDQVKACEDAREVALVARNERRRVPVHLDETHAPATHDITPCADPLSLIGMSADYDRFSGEAVRIALLDTGIDLRHPDFAGRFQEGKNAVSFVAGESVQDGLGHGTHCAGVVAGPRVPTAGERFAVAPGAELLIGKVLGDSGLGNDDQVIDGIHWALHQGARVISLSLGSSREPGDAGSAMYEHLARRTLHREHGALLIAATGNESSRPDEVAAVENPAAAASVMAVAAVDGDDEVAYFSGGQRDAVGEVNVAAPGVGIRSTWLGGTYRAVSGTSMATPHVAGVAALHLEQSPTLSPQALWQRLQDQARPTGAEVDVGNGVVQAP